MDGLSVTIEKSKDRAKNNDVSSSMVHFVILTGESAVFARFLARSGVERRVLLWTGGELF